MMTSIDVISQLITLRNNRWYTQCSHANNFNAFIPLFITGDVVLLNNVSEKHNWTQSSLLATISAFSLPSSKTCGAKFNRFIVSAFPELNRLIMSQNV